MSMLGEHVQNRDIMNGELRAIQASIRCLVQHQLTSGALGVQRLTKPCLAYDMPG